MHISIPIDQTVEFINVTSINPLVSKCQIKVCYVGEQPNRNNTVITKEVATEMGKKLPGSPIVGYFNQEQDDFEEHSREISLKDGKFAIIDRTRPYGFVDVNAKVWFQKFLDDNSVEREYLVTEGYIWTGVYPESQRTVEQGNNQSMELHKDSIKGYWAGDKNSNSRFFIFSEAIIEKLCILGEDYEPCFEGSQIKAQFSLENEFAELRNTMFSMMNELKEAINKGGSEEFMLDPKVEAPETVEDPTIVENTTEVAGEFAKEEEKEEKNQNPEDKSEKEEPKDSEDNNEDEKESEDKEEEKEKSKYNLEEVVEYTELKNEYEELSSKYSTLETEHNNLLAEVESLKEFKLVTERTQKQEMINSFYMLSEEDKKDVTENIDSYSLDDIEAKLAVLCVRNKVSFSLDEEEKKETAPDVFNLNSTGLTDDTPEWIKAVKNTTASRI